MVLPEIAQTQQTFDSKSIKEIPALFVGFDKLANDVDHMLTQLAVSRAYEHETVENDSLAL